ncbi:MAG: YqiA/YcfP family alpha/beta fold hydrolase [Myxococcota bacterium]
MRRWGMSLEAFNAGLTAWHEGRFFDAHEHWEDAWRAATDDGTAVALKGLIQLAASLHKADSGEAEGHRKLWTKARQHLHEGAEALGALHGIDLVAFFEALPEGPGLPHHLPALPEHVSAFGVLYLHGFGSSPTSPKGAAVQGAIQPSGTPMAAPSLADDADFFEFTVTRSLRRARRCLFDRTLLVGSSLGGWIGSLLARDDPRVVELILLCPAYRYPDRWRRPERAEELARWRSEGQLDFEVGHPPHRLPLSVTFIEDAFGHDAAVQPTVPTTIYHGRQDDVVPLRDVAPIVEGLPNVELHVVDDDHGLRSTLPEIARLCLARAEALRGQGGSRDR